MASNTGSNGTVQTARPRIVVAGSDVPALADGLLSLVVAEDTQGLYRCEAGFGNWGTKANAVDFLYYDRKTIDFGKPFQVKVDADVIFDGRVMALEGHFPRDSAPQLVLLAEDRFQDLRMTRRSRSFADITDTGVFNQIASEHGLTPKVKVQGPKHRVLAQVNQSDLAFSPRARPRDRRRSLGQWHDAPRPVAHRPRRRAVPDRIPGKLREFSVLADLAHQRTSVTVGGWDVARKTAIAHKADDSLIAGELHGDVSGASVLTKAVGARKEALAHTAPVNDQEAQAEAESYFKMNARRFVTARGLADLDSRLRAGNFVSIQGVGPLFSGKYYLTSVKHLFDGIFGLRTEFTAERPGLGKV